jgi:glycosyltransferase involved in cell wall biosynthesis
MDQKIDILMAVYNGAHYVLAQLHSMMEQTYPHFRIIIRDNCSSDQTVSLIEQFSRQHPGKIFLIKGTENLGAMGNFATLVHYAEAPYVMFSDADDVWLPTKIEESLALMQKNEANYGAQMPILIHTDLTVVDKELNILGHSFWNYSRLNPYNAHALNRLLIHNVITGCTTLVNQPLLKLAAPIPKEAIMHDWWLGLVASAFGKIDHLAKPTILYRQHGKNDTGAKNWKSLSTYLAQTKKALQTVGRAELRQRLFRTIQQASQFLNRYEGQLEPHKKRIIQNYVALATAGPLQKRYLFLRHRYFKNMLTKNIGTFLFL